MLYVQENNNAIAVCFWEDAGGGAYGIQSRKAKVSSIILLVWLMVMAMVFLLPVILPKERKSTL